MQEIFEKIKERLEEKAFDLNRFYCYYNEGFNVGLKNAIEIVNQVAEEYVPDKNVGEIEEFCEWKREVYYDKCPHEEGLFKRVHYDEAVERAFKHCPYCGKKIKVVE